MTAETNQALDRGQRVSQRRPHDATVEHHDEYCAHERAGERSQDQGPDSVASKGQQPAWSVRRRLRTISSAMDNERNAVVSPAALAVRRRLTRSRAPTSARSSRGSESGSSNRSAASGARSTITPAITTLQIMIAALAGAGLGFVKLGLLARVRFPSPSRQTARRSRSSPWPSPAGRSHRFEQANDKDRDRPHDQLEAYLCRESPASAAQGGLSEAAVCHGRTRAACGPSPRSQISVCASLKQRIGLINGRTLPGRGQQRLRVAERGRHHAQQRRAMKSDPRTAVRKSAKDRVPMLTGKPSFVGLAVTLRGTRPVAALRSPVLFRPRANFNARGMRMANSTSR